MEGGMPVRSRVFVTGQPGVGKTTLVIRVLENLRKAHPNLGIHGFHTREVRNGIGERVGFDVVTVDGRTAPLATTSTSTSTSSMCSPSSSGIRGRTAPVAQAKVGKYIVDVGQFEALVLPELALARESGAAAGSLFVIDEVGRMELFSPSFFPAVWEILDSGVAAAAVLGTIPVPRYGRQIAEIERITKRADVALYTLTKSNRDAMAKAVYSHLDSLLSR